jgi:hypothetical protein
LINVAKEQELIYLQNIVNNLQNKLNDTQNELEVVKNNLTKVQNDLELVNEKIQTIENMHLPLYNKGTFENVSSLPISVNFINTIYNIIEINIRVTLTNTGGSNVILSANDNNNTTLSIGEPQESYIRYDLSTTTSKSGYLLQSCEGLGTDNLISIKVVKGVSSLKMNFFRTSNVYIWANIGTTRTDTSGIFNSANLNNIIITVVNGKFSGSWSSINY